MTETLFVCPVRDNLTEASLEVCLEVCLSAVDKSVVLRPVDRKGVMRRASADIVQNIEL